MAREARDARRLMEPAAVRIRVHPAKVIGEDQHDVGLARGSFVRGG
jgi:hypothetical protein